MECKRVLSNNWVNLWKVLFPKICLNTRLLLSRYTTKNNYTTIHRKMVKSVTFTIGLIPRSPTGWALHNLSISTHHHDGCVVGLDLIIVIAVGMYLENKSRVCTQTYENSTCLVLASSKKNKLEPTSFFKKPHRRCVKWIYLSSGAHSLKHISVIGILISPQLILNKFSRITVNTSFFNMDV